MVGRSHVGRGAIDVVPGAGGAVRRAVGSIYLAGLLAVVLVAASPYLGVHVGDAFTMYSGLDTHDAGWNSLVVPRELHVLG